MSQLGYDKLDSGVSMVGVPEMNVYCECGKMKSHADLNTSEDISACLTKYFSSDSEELFENDGSITDVNLDDECILTFNEASQIMSCIAHHSPAYGMALTDCDAKGILTMSSMQSDNDADKCTWYGSINNEKLHRICPNGFPEGNDVYWQDFIGFLLICVWPDKRTITYLVGADSD